MEEREVRIVCARIGWARDPAEAARRAVDPPAAGRRHPLPFPLSPPPARTFCASQDGVTKSTCDAQAARPAAHALWAPAAAVLLARGETTAEPGQDLGPHLRLKVSSPRRVARAQVLADRESCQIGLRTRRPTCGASSDRPTRAAGSARPTYVDLLASFAEALASARVLTGAHLLDVAR